MDSPEKYALVTGASSGIGREIALILGGLGYPLVAVSNQADRLGTLKKEIEGKGGPEVRTLDLDLAHEHSAQEVYDFCRENGIRVEVLVNSAGILVYGETVRAGTERVRSLLQLHMTTPVLLCRLFAEEMIRRGTGFILNVSSIASVMPYPTISLYGPTKTFLRSFTRALRTELKPLGIRISCLMPGAVDTGLYEGTGFGISKGRRLGLVKGPETVARAGVRALFRDRAECVPGVLNKLVLRLVPFVPRFVISLIYSKTRTRGNP